MSNQNHPLLVAFSNFIDEMKVKDTKIEEMEKEMKVRDTKIEEMEKEMKVRDTKIEEMEKEMKKMQKTLEQVQAQLAKIRMRDLLIAFRIHVREQFIALVPGPSGSSSKYWEKRKNYDSLVEQILDPEASAAIKDKIAALDQMHSNYSATLKYSMTTSQFVLDSLAHDMASFLANKHRSEADIQAVESSLQTLTPESKVAATTMLSAVVEDEIVVEEKEGASPTKRAAAEVAVGSEAGPSKKKKKKSVK